MILQQNNIYNFQEQSDITYSEYNKGLNPYIPVVYSDFFSRFDIYSKKVVDTDISSITIKFVNTKNDSEYILDTQYYSISGFTDRYGDNVRQISYEGNVLDPAIPEGSYIIKVITSTSDGVGGFVTFYSDEVCLVGNYGIVDQEAISISYDANLATNKVLTFDITAGSSIDITVYWGDGTNTVYSGATINASKTIPSTLISSVLITGDISLIETITFNASDMITDITNLSAFDGSIELEGVSFIGNSDSRFGNMNLVDITGAFQNGQTLTLQLESTDIIDFVINKSTDNTTLKLDIDDCALFDRNGSFLQSIKFDSNTDEFIVTNSNKSTFSSFINNKPKVVGLSNNLMSVIPNISGLGQYEGLEIFRVSFNAISYDPITEDTIYYALVNGAVLDFSYNFLDQQTVDKIISTTANNNIDVGGVTLSLNGSFPQNPVQKNAVPTRGYDVAKGVFSSNTQKGASYGWSVGEKIQSAQGSTAQIQLTVSGGVITGTTLITGSGDWNSDDYIIVANAYGQTQGLSSGEGGVLSLTSSGASGNITGIAIEEGGSGYVNNEILYVYGGLTGSRAFEVEVTEIQLYGSVSKVLISTQGEDQVTGVNAFQYVGASSPKYVSVILWDGISYIESEGGTVNYNT